MKWWYAPGIADIPQKLHDNNTGGYVGPFKTKHEALVDSLERRDRENAALRELAAHYRKALNSIASLQIAVTNDSSYDAGRKIAYYTTGELAKRALEGDNEVTKTTRMKRAS